MELADVRQSTLGAALHHAADRWGGRTFLQTTSRDVTFEECRREAMGVAQFLLELGVVKGDKVAIMLDNCAEFITTWFGISQIGAVEVSINTAFKGEILRHLLADSEARLLVCHEKYLESVQTVAPTLPALEHVLVLDGTGSADSALPAGVAVSQWGGAKLTEQTPSPGWDVTGMDVAQLSYTSGTTGRSKGVIIPHNRIVQTARDMISLRSIADSDVLYTCLPLFHGNAKYLTTMPGLLAGAGVVLDESFSASRFWKQVAASKATQFNYLGVMIAILAKQPVPVDGEIPHRLTLGWGAGAPRDITMAFEERFGLTLIEGYGLTEGGIVLSNRSDDRRIGSCGKPMSGYEVRVVDDTDSDVVPDEVGEIVIRPRRPFTTMLGYHGLPDESLAAFRNMWLHTGDLARRDVDGFFYFVDRSKDAIRRRGENISSQEIEAIVNSLPEVLESAAVPVASEVTEDDVMVVVHLRDDADLTIEDLLRHCENAMPAFWVPRYMHVSKDPLPRTPTNKIEKFKLKGLSSHLTTHDRLPRDHTRSISSDDGAVMTG